MHTHATIGVDDWKAMLEAVGLSAADLDHWHGLFEARHPDDHQRFLEWLGLPAERIAAVRRDSRARPPRT